MKNIKTKGEIEMKKIGIAVFALMFVGMSYVGAQEVEIDFDGESDIQDIKKSEGFSMPEAFSDIEYNVPAPKREVKYDYNNGMLMRYYISQDKIKKIVSEYYSAKGDYNSAQRVLGKDIKIAANDFTVYVIGTKVEEKINDVRLAISIGKVVGSRSQQKVASIIAGAAVIIGCMTNDECWEDVGDGVSAVSEWVHSN
ncbi:MAG: hypothetical protein U9Q34_04835 [Elusimicrobiota bacterium]|nr:hypothetical protein [Elusimicrobiota bacterium]